METDDDKLISQYSKLFHNEGFIVEVIDLITPVNPTVSFDALQQVQNAADAKWFANQLEAPWLLDDPYWHIRAASLIASFIRVLKYADQNVYFSALVKIVDDLYIGVMRDGKAPSHIEKLLSDIISVDPHCDLVDDLKLFAPLPIETLKVVCKHSSKILDYYFRYSTVLQLSICPHSAHEPCSKPRPFCLSELIRIALNGTTVQV